MRQSLLEDSRVRLCRTPADSSASVGVKFLLPTGSHSRGCPAASSCNRGPPSRPGGTRGRSPGVRAQLCVASSSRRRRETIVGVPFARGWRLPPSGWSQVRRHSPTARGNHRPEIHHLHCLPKQVRLTNLHSLGVPSYTPKLVSTLKLQLFVL